MSNAPTDQTPDVDWLLTSLMNVPHTRVAVLASGDGIARGAQGLSVEDAQVLAAHISSSWSLARGLGKRFGDAGAAGGQDQMMMKVADLFAFVRPAGAGAVLAVLAGQDVDAAIVWHEMAHLIRRFHPELVSSKLRNPLDGVSR